LTSSVHHDPARSCRSSSRCRRPPWPALRLLTFGWHQFLTMQGGLRRLRNSSVRAREQGMAASTYLHPPHASSFDLDTALLGVCRDATPARTMTAAATHGSEALACSTSLPTFAMPRPRHRVHTHRKAVRRRRRAQGCRRHVASDLLSEDDEITSSRAWVLITGRRRMGQGIRLGIEQSERDAMQHSLRGQLPLSCVAYGNGERSRPPCSRPCGFRVQRGQFCK